MVTFPGKIFRNNIFILKMSTFLKQYLYIKLCTFPGQYLYFQMFVVTTIIGHQLDLDIPV